jgi:flagellar protein FliS
MSGMTFGAAGAYARVGLETRVASAQPMGLILMLYDGALLALGRARERMSAGDPHGKGTAISRAIQILDEGLKASLDRNAGGELAGQLWQLYEYMGRRLLLASLRNEPAGLDEVETLLRELRGAWAQIGSSAPVTTATRLRVAA